jgi:hypothetical protein
MNRYRDDGNHGRHERGASMRHAESYLHSKMLELSGVAPSSELKDDHGFPRDREHPMRGIHHPDATPQ